MLSFSTFWNTVTFNVIPRYLCRPAERQIKGWGRGRGEKGEGGWVVICAHLLVVTAASVFYTDVALSWLSWLLNRKLYCQC